MTLESQIRPSTRNTNEHPLSWFQERLWLQHQKNPKDVSYNIPVFFAIDGLLDVDALEQSLRAIRSRHSGLRARFKLNETDEPVQVIELREDFRLPAVDARESDVARHIQEVAGHIFDLSKGALLVARLLRLEQKKHLLLLNVHHIAADGWSIEGILFAELQQFYAAFATRTSPTLQPLPISYTDFAYWQRSQDLSAALSYWQNQLSDYEASLELPADELRRPQSGRHSETFVYRYEKEFSLSLEQFAQEHGCTLFMCLMAAFALTVSRYTGREDMCIGTTTSGRMRPEIEGLIGFFINILPLRIHVDEALTVDEYLSKVREVALAGFEHQAVPFERIVNSMALDHSKGPASLVPLVLRHQNFPRTQLGTMPAGIEFLPYSDQCASEVTSKAGAAARCEVELSYTGDRDDLRVEVVYASDLFRRATIERLLAHHREVLTSMMRGGRRLLSEISLLTDADTHRLCVEYNRTRRTTKTLRTFSQRWDEQVQKSPDAIACHDQRGIWRYREIASLTLRLSHALIARGVKPGDIVGVSVDRGAQLLVSLLAVWKAGAAYVPLDPSYPDTYLKQILSDVAPVQTICTVSTQSKLGLTEQDGYLLDHDLASLSGYPEWAPNVACTPESLAYVMYTSGSTGVPKGVRVPHRQLVNWLEGIEENWPFAPGEVFAQKTTMAFAVSVKEIFSGLLNGSALAFLDASTVQDVTAFVSALAQHRVTRLNLVPSHLQAVLTQLREQGLSLPNLRICTTAGEPLTAELVAAFRTQLPNARLLNNYGCTELNDITYYDTAAFDGTQGFVPIGRPIQNTQLYVLDARGRLVPEGVAGELHVSSVGMSLGYHNRQSLTEERYLKNRFDGDSGDVLYNTGDVVRYLADGNLEYIGRWDFQVKVRGFRVDVRHVEKILGEYAGIGLRAVVGDGSQLLAFYIVQPGHVLQVGALREFLECRLPAYMVPSAFVEVTAMPRLPNGKLDRRALKPSLGRMQRSDTHESPRTETEVQLSSIWSEVLEVPEDDIGRQTHFFEIGGHSLAATRLVARVRGQLGVELGLSQVFEHPRLDDLSRYVDTVRETGQLDEDEVTQAPLLRGGPEREKQGSGLLDDKVILVSGSSRGIGFAAVRLLASHGAKVAINYMHNQARAQRAKALIEQEGGTAEVFQADMTNREQVGQMVENVRARFGRIDVLVTNAAIGYKIRPFLEQDWSDFERKLTDELKSVFYVCQAVVPEMLQRRSGSIIAVSSTMSKVAETGYAAHGTAKAALDAFVRSLAFELGPEGIRVNTVAPGLTLTDASASFPHQQKQAAASRCPMRRNGLPRDVAGAILFLASDLSQFMTGTYLPVDGGLTML